MPSSGNSNETPKKNDQPTRLGSSKPAKSPRPRKWVGDELGKNRVQQSIKNYFSPSSASASNVPFVKEENTSRRELFPKRIPVGKLVVEPVVISDDEELNHLSMENYHSKTKTSSINLKKRTVPLSRKSLKFKTETKPASVQEVATKVEYDEPKSLNSASSKTAAKFLDSQRKGFQKQHVTYSQDISLEATVGSEVLKVIPPPNNSNPSLLSTKSRKRKNTGSAVPTSTSSAQKDVKRTPLPDVEVSGGIGLAVGSNRVLGDSNDRKSDLKGRKRKGAESVVRVSKSDVDCSVTPSKRSNRSDVDCGSSVPRSTPVVVPSSSKNVTLKRRIVVESRSKRASNNSDDLSHLFRDSQMIDVVSGVGVIKTECGSVPVVKTENVSPPAGNQGQELGYVLSNENTKVKIEQQSPTTDSATIHPWVKTEPVDGSSCYEPIPTDRQPKVESTSIIPPNQSTSYPVVSESEGGVLVTLNQSGLTVKTVAKEIARLEDINWAEPMEQEILMSPSKKSTSTNLLTPQKRNDSLGGASPKKKVQIALFPNTPSKSTAGPSSSKQTPSKSPNKGSPRKKGSPMKLDKDAISGNLLFEHCIAECKRYANFAFKFNPTNKKVADDYLSLFLPEKILLHYLLMRKWAWIRLVDMKYDKFIHNKDNSLDVLRDKGFLEDMTLDENMEVILGALKRPELGQLCKQQKINSTGTKVELASRLSEFASKQGGFNFSSKSLKTVLKQSAFTLLGRCIRLAEGARNALQNIFEASMSPLYLEGQFYTFQERLRGMETLMKDVKFNGKKLLPLMLSSNQLFMTSSQFDEYVSSVILKFDILSARDSRDTNKGVELARGARAFLLIHLSSADAKAFLEKTPRYIWRYTAGSNYTSALDCGIDLFKKAKEYGDAIMSIDVLLAQGWFRKHCRGHWYAEKVLIMDKHQKKGSDEIFPVLSKGLTEDLTSLGRLELSKKAEGILNKKKGGLSPEQKDEIRRLMRIPRLNHRVKEIKSTEAPNMSSGTRQTYVEISAEGERIYSNVEQTAKNSYMGELPEGLHDEGAFLKNIIFAVFWPVIYAPMENMFVAQYQHSPLDWGTQAFYRNRQSQIQDHISCLREGGIDSVMQQITDVLSNYTNYHSLVNWSYISYDMLPAIRNIVVSLTVDKLLKLSEYLLESYRERRSGWPDLTLWNTVTGRFKLVEVKSTNDELSFKQIVWLEKFAEMGIDVEECRVNASNKGKRRKALGSTPFSDASQEVMD